METLSQAEIFFLISSVGFVILWILAGILLFYLIHIIKTFSQIMDKIERDINKVGDITKEMFEELKNSIVWNFLFKKKRKTRKN
jgi:hypothetical protein